MSSPPREVEAEHLTPSPSPSPSPPLTEVFLRKPQASSHSNDGSTASGSPQHSPLRNQPKIKDPSPPPSLTEMVFQNPRVSDNSKFGNTLIASLQSSSLVREALDPSPPTSSPPLTEKVFPKPHASGYFKVGIRATGSSQRSPLGDEARDLSPLPLSPPLVEMNFQKPQRSDHQDLDDEVAVSSPPPSFYDAEQSIPQPSADGAPRNSLSEPLALDFSDTENLPISSLQQLSARDDGQRSFSPSSSPPVAEKGLSTSKSSKRNEDQLASPTLSPFRLIKGTTHLPPVPSLPRPPNNTPEKPESPGMTVQMAAMAVATRLSQEDLAVVAKVVGGGGVGVTGVVDSMGRGGRGGGGGWPGERGSSSAPRGVERGDAWVAALAFRVGALVLSLIAFSVMAANKTQGWAGDTFDRYEEYRFLMSANVIVFIYSGFQVYATAKVHHMIAKSRILGRPICHYFDLSMDQILSYLLMSASSAAASRNDIWVTRFNSDKFTHRIDVSVAMSFLAFVALASSSVISCYNLFNLSP